MHKKIWTYREDVCAELHALPIRFLEAKGQPWDAFDDLAIPADLGDGPELSLRRGDEGINCLGRTFSIE